MPLPAFRQDWRARRRALSFRGRMDIEPDRWHTLLKADAEFCRASRLWTGSFALADETGFVSVTVAGGDVRGVVTGAGASSAEVTFSGPAEGWAKVLAAVPPPYYQDLIGGAVGRHGFLVSGDVTRMAAYYPAIQRAVRLAATARGV